ncbi:hypothetical protein I316_00334 [Kwoniella heveanensis BCC8398]|uniref:Uncharacterized protein n=1 Tax=Kwoniella heveanensis BCC8398 TaxID=1296120 RepID=A0A1B9H4B8_9TREE|nr:hypothetical protein I316_00334 [Kwoniella heveanensis BCC8398]
MGLLALFRLRSRQINGSCVLDVPIEAYDKTTGLPATIQVGGKEVEPYVSLQEAISDLQLSFEAQDSLDDSPVSARVLVAISSEPYIHWAQHILNQRQANGSTPARTSETDMGSGVSGNKGIQEPIDHERKCDQLAEDALPHLGILMAWHAHLLNPIRYENDLDGDFSALKGLNFPLAAVAKAIQEGSLPPVKPLDDTQKACLDVVNRTTTAIISASSEPGKGWTSKDVALATQRQAKFVGHMERIEWLEQRYWETTGYTELQFGVVLYHAWLDLMHASSSRYFLVPRLDIDLAWHTHQLHHAGYNTDTTGLLGKMLNHDDAAGENKLGDGLEMTKKLWKKRFGHAYM